MGGEKYLSAGEKANPALGLRKVVLPVRPT